MPRTVIFREIWKLTEEEIRELESKAQTAIWREHEKFIGLTRYEFDNSKWKDIRHYFTRIKTSDKAIIYIAGSTLINKQDVPGDLLARVVGEQIGYYREGLFVDITKLAGMKLSAQCKKFSRVNGVRKEILRVAELQLPERKEGVAIIFFDDKR